MAAKIVILTTAGSDEQAEKIATSLVDEKLAACVNIITGVHSIYRWKDKVWKDTEKLLVVKTSSHLFEQVRKRIKQMHTYELPEVIALPIEKSDEDVLKWIDNSVLERTVTKKKKVLR